MDSKAFVPPNDWLQPSENDNTALSVGFLLSTTLLAILLRFYRLDGASLWVDEILTWNMIRPDHGLNIWTQVWDAIQAPLYLLFIWPLVRLQENEIMMRLPAAIAGVVTIPLFGVFLSRFLDNKTAQLGTILMAISPYHVWYSQESRGYSFLILFAVLLALAFIEMIKNGPRSSTVFYFIFAGACSVLSNMSGLFLLIGVGMAVLLLHRPQGVRQWIMWALALGGAVAVSSPWILKASGIWAVDRLVPGAETGLSLRGQTTFSPMALPYSIYTFFYGYSFGPSLRELHQPDRLAVLKANLPWMLAGAVPVGIGLISSLRHLGRKRLFLLVFVTVPVVILVLLAVRNIKPWNPRYVSVVFPFLIALLALGLTRLNGAWGRSLAVLMVVLSFWSLSGYYWNNRYSKADVRSATAFVQEHNVIHEPVFVPVVTGVYHFYSDGEGTIIDSYHQPAFSSEMDAQKFFINKLAGFEKFWFVSSREWYLDPNGYLPLVLSRNGHLRLEKSLPGIKIYHWNVETEIRTKNER